MYLLIGKMWFNVVNYGLIGMDGKWIVNMDSDTVHVKIIIIFFQSCSDRFCLRSVPTGI